MKKNLLLYFALTLIPFFAEAKTTNGSTAASQDEVLASAYNELSQIDQLIQATEANLARQKKLRNFIAEYRKLEKECIAHPKDTSKLFKLAEVGKQTLDTIDESSLSEYFRPEFLKELQGLRQIANKKSVPPVK